MSANLHQKFKWHFEHPRYGWYLILISLVILLAPFGEMFHLGRHLLEIVYAALLIVGPYFVATDYKRWLWLTVLGVFLAVVFILDVRSDVTLIIFPILTLGFFTLTFFEILKYVMRASEISFNTILATISGYAVLAIAVAPLCFLLENTIPGAFKLPDTMQFFDFIYYGFVTVTTVGYGDIVPVHPIAKSIAVFLSMAGQIYLTVVMGLIIGQFLSSREVIVKNQNDQSSDGV